MPKVKKYNYYMPAGSKTNLGGSCIYYKEYFNDILTFMAALCKTSTIA